MLNGTTNCVRATLNAMVINAGKCNDTAIRISLTEALLEGDPPCSGSLTFCVSGLGRDELFNFKADKILPEVQHEPGEVHRTDTYATEWNVCRSLDLVVLVVVFTEAKAHMEQI